MASVYDWSLISGDNASADADLTWAEGQAPGTVNASARTMMKRVAELLADMGGTITATGSANTLLVTANSAFTTYANGRMVSFKAADDNTGAATLNVNSIGAKSLRRATIADGDAPLIAGNIQAGCIYVAIYNTSLNSGAGGWALVNETTSRADFVTLAGTETLTNKTLTTPTITLKQGASAAPTAEGDIQWDSDDNRLVIGDGSATKTFTPNPASTVQGDIEYYTAVDTKARLAKGTAKQVLTMNSGASAPEWATPIFSKEFISSQQTITNAGQISVAHGLGVAPKLVQPLLVCVEAENGYSVGDVLLAHAGYQRDRDRNDGLFGFLVTPDDTNIVVRVASNGFTTGNKTNGTESSGTNSRWRLVLKAWA